MAADVLQSFVGWHDGTTGHESRATHGSDLDLPTPQPTTLTVSTDAPTALPSAAPSSSVAKVFSSNPSTPPAPTTRSPSSASLVLTPVGVGTFVATSSKPPSSPSAAMPAPASGALVFVSVRVGAIVTSSLVALLVFV
ncbi:hypothetical protein MHU86_8553 [Fragilaria crotonensis]|nr:hypothetical protein MHU86_8553 [Fragilaria crotonensis]